MESIDVWIVHKEKEILISNAPGVPADVTSYVSEEARKAAEARGYATVSEVGFPAEIYHRADNWEAARVWAEEKNKSLGYKIETLDIWEAAEEEYEEEYISICETCGGESGDGWSQCICELDDFEYWEMEEII